MYCTIHRSSRREYTYLYLRRDCEFRELPRELQAAFGEPQPVMELELTPDRSLAQEDVRQVMKNLSERGWHLQLPPEDDPGGWLDLPRQDRG